MELGAVTIMFALSLLLDQPTFVYNSFYLRDEGTRSLTLADSRDVADFAHRFLIQAPGGMYSTKAVSTVLYLCLVM